MLGNHRPQPAQIGFQRNDAPERQIGILEAGMGLLNDAAEIALEHLDGIANDPAHLGIDGGVAPVGAVGDAEALNAA